MNKLQENPFSFKTPEIMKASEIVDLFVPINDYYNIQDSGHIFVHGHRGCGKSMMFRFIAPECQTIYRKTDVQSLPYYGVYLSIKKTDLNLVDFDRLANQIHGYIINEHLMVGYFIVKILQSLNDNLSSYIDENKKMTELREFFERSIFRRLKNVGWDNSNKPTSKRSAEKMIKDIIEVFDTIHAQTFYHLKKLYSTDKLIPYEGPLLGFQDFLLPIIRDLRSLSFMPSEAPVYLLIDDADNLSLQQTEVLNTWVSYRSTEDLSLKISTQLRYKTYRTITGSRIESPHDYSEITISNVYTGSAKDKYPEWVREIVKKRLKKANINISPKDFFPIDAKQENEIKKIAQEFKDNWSPEDSIGYRPRDDAYRYARPEYIKQEYYKVNNEDEESVEQTDELIIVESIEDHFGRPEYIKRLGGISKQRSNYKYAGFEQLVHISSGIIRFFLDPAGKMFSEEQRNNPSEPVTVISPSVQDKVIRDEADNIMFSEFTKIIDDIKQSKDTDAPKLAQNTKKLRNLIAVLGSTFFEYLISSDRSERKFFSFAISDEPDDEVSQIIKLGVEYGYFYESSVGTKEGRGRTPLYVLSRRVAPYFNLDPMGFSGYKFLTNNFLRKAISEPKTMQGIIKKKGVETVIDEELPLFKGIEQ